MKLRLLAVALTLPLAGLAWAQDPTIDRLLAAQCAQCHGTNGHAVGDIDALAGEGLAELYEEVLEMKAESPAEDIMEHQALGYTDEQLYRIARYFSTQQGEIDDDD